MMVAERYLRQKKLMLSAEKLKQLAEIIEEKINVVSLEVVDFVSKYEEQSIKTFCLPVEI